MFRLLSKNLQFEELEAIELDKQYIHKSGSTSLLVCSLENHQPKPIQRTRLNLFDCSIWIIDNATGLYVEFLKGACFSSSRAATFSTLTHMAPPEGGGPTWKLNHVAYLNLAQTKPSG